MIISGERFAFGYHYLRPNETYHEPTRKFFRNEVFRIPIYEVLPLETIWQQCWVMDIPTFCKGRPIGSVEEHVYICEYRVDKKARLFDKIPKTSGKGKKSKSNDLSFCTKWFAFDMFDVRLKPSRNYAVSYLSIYSMCILERVQPFLDISYIEIFFLFPPSYVVSKLSYSQGARMRKYSY